jgi:hypothetical protein
VTYARGGSRVAGHRGDRERRLPDVRANRHHARVGAADRPVDRSQRGLWGGGARRRVPARSTSGASGRRLPCTSSPPRRRARSTNRRSFSEEGFRHDTVPSVARLHRDVAALRFAVEEGVATLTLSRRTDSTRCVPHIPRPARPSRPAAPPRRRARAGQHGRSLELARERLSGADLEWLRSRKPAARRDGVQSWHGGPRNAVWEYVGSSNARACLAAQRAELRVVGHTHVPGAWQKTPRGARRAKIRPGVPLDIATGKWLLNPGPVGRPEDAPIAY